MCVPASVQTKLAIHIPSKYTSRETLCHCRLLQFILPLSPYSAWHFTLLFIVFNSPIVKSNHLHFEQRNHSNCLSQFQKREREEEENRAKKVSLLHQHLHHLLLHLLQCSCVEVCKIESCKYSVHCFLHPEVNLITSTLLVLHLTQSSSSSSCVLHIVSPLTLWHRLGEISIASIIYYCHSLNSPFSTTHLSLSLSPSSQLSVFCVSFCIRATFPGAPCNQWIDQK